MPMSYRDMAAAGNEAAAGAPGPPIAKGPAVQYFHCADPNDNTARYLWSGVKSKTPGGFNLLQSHGWLDCELMGGTSLEEASARCQPGNPASWPRVLPRQDLLFTDRRAIQRPAPQGAMPVHPSRLREAEHDPPRLSVLLARWGGKHKVGKEWGGEEDDGEGGWGDYGSPPCDWYISAMLREGVMRHPLVSGEVDAALPVSNRRAEELTGLLNVEVHSLFVGSSKGCAEIAKAAPFIEQKMQGVSKASFWMLWPGEWDDFPSADYAGYVQRHVLFDAMRACEASSIRSTFPHPSVLYEFITSKTWMATLSPYVESALPAAVIVNKDDYIRDPLQAARRALAGLEEIRAKNPFPKDGEEKPAPSVINRDRIRKGVVKLGWSWEARFVAFFDGEKQLAEKLKDLLIAEGCLAAEAVVQEWVDFDFELRLFFLPPADWTPATNIAPTRLEFNGWGASEKGSAGPGCFLKLNQNKVLAKWQGDKEALDAAQERAIQISQFLLAHLFETHSEPVAMVRLDFMLHRIRPGKARVVFGEYCEMGACCISWQDGPPTIWRAALDYAMR